MTIGANFLGVGESFLRITRLGLFGGETGRGREQDGNS